MSLLSSIILEVAVPIPLNKTFDFLYPMQEEAMQKENEGVDDKLIKSLQDKIGCRVLIPFGSQKKVGVLLSIKSESDFSIKKLKPIINLLDETPLILKDIQFLSTWASSYYHYPQGEVFHQCFPVLLRQANTFKQALDLIEEKVKLWTITPKGMSLDPLKLKRAKRQLGLLNYLKQHSKGVTKLDLDRDESSGWQASIKKLVDEEYVAITRIKKDVLEKGEFGIAIETDSSEKQLALNEEQDKAVSELQKKLGSFYACLLYGITGSGKTEVYLQFIKSVLDNQQQVLILVPEINLTPQLFERFKKRFNIPIATLHSSLNNKQRMANWLSASNGKARIIIGTRSAIFTPMQNLGAIILDEEHDASFKQQEGFRYHARDVAMVRAKYLKIPIILGSATPSFESLANVTEKKYHCFKLTQRAGNAKPPKITLLDVRNKLIDHGISHLLKSQIALELEKDNQIIIFQNRRGFAPLTFCHQCGWTARCVSCDANLTTHQGGNYMLCHHCEAKFPIPSSCLSCRSDQIEQLGAGTERVETSLSDLFPDVEIFRIDRDTTRGKDQFAKVIEKVQKGKKQILVGTQMLSKGHHFPNVTLVVILDIDQGLFSSDFRAMEKMAQLIVQVSGRAGREEKQGHVVLQTHQPDHPFFHQLLANGYGVYAKDEMLERQQMQMPPYWYLTMLRCEADVEQTNMTYLQQCVEIGQQLLANQEQSSIQIIGPVPAPMQRKAGRFRSQLLVQAENRMLMQKFLTQWLSFFPKSNKVKWSVDVDPQDMS